MNPKPSFVNECTMTTRRENHTRPGNSVYNESKTPLPMIIHQKKVQEISIRSSCSDGRSRCRKIRGEKYSRAREAECCEGDQVPPPLARWRKHKLVVKIGIVSHQQESVNDGPGLDVSVGWTVGGAVSTPVAGGAAWIWSR